MRFIVLFILSLFLSVSAMADTLRCEYEKPHSSTINRAKGLYPHLDDRQIDTVASLLELIDKNYLSMATGVQGEQTRALVARTEALAMRILDLRIHTYYIKDQMVKVQEKMRAEKEAGLEEISTELDSDSRSFAIDMVSLYLESGTIKSEVFQLYVDRLAALSAGVDGSEITKDICTLISTIDGALSDSPDRVPDLLMFAYGERLKY